MAICPLHSARRSQIRSRQAVDFMADADLVRVSQVHENILISHYRRILTGMILRNADWTIWRSLTKTRGPLCAVVQCINKKKRRAGAPFYVRYYPECVAKLDVGWRAG